MRSWRSWRWMQSANGYTFPKEIIIYNIYYIYYILLFIFTYLRIRLKSRQNAYNPKPTSPLLRSSWPSWPHDLMTSWPLDKTGGLQLRGTCNCSFSVLTNQGVDRQEPYPNFRVQFRDCPSDFLSNVPLYRLHFYHRNWDGNPFWFRLDSDDYFISSLDTSRTGSLFSCPFTEEHPRIGIAISKLVALLSPRRSSTW